MKHCNKELIIKTGKEKGQTLFYAECEVCKLRKKSVDKKEVEKFFSNDNIKNQHSLGAFNPPQTRQLEKIPAKRDQLTKWGLENLDALMNRSALFIENPATKKMIADNIRYISNLSGTAWDKVWSTQEGQESISEALCNANYYAATLGKMGDLVPFGSTCKFIEAIECYKFALTKGKSAPFTEILIDTIHVNDTQTNDQIDGSFIFTLKRGVPRGKVIAVAVQAKIKDTGKIIGNIYDVERLLGKAEEHSQGYKAHLKNKENFNILRSEGKLLKDIVGREYYINPIKKKNGEIWNKEVYADDSTSPYDGADLEEMMIKSAGKSFFRHYMDSRNAHAMAEEWGEDESLSDDATMEQAADHVLKQAAGQFKTQEAPYNRDIVDTIKDAEIIVEKTTATGPTVSPEEKKEPAEEKEVDKKDAAQFDECEEINGL